MTFDSNILSALLTSFISILIFYLGQQYINRKGKEQKRTDDIEWKVTIENKLNDILKIQDKVSVLESNCNNYHSRYDKELNTLTNADIMAAKDLERLFKEIEGMNYSVNQLRDSNLKLVEQLKSLADSNEKRDRELNKKIDDLYRKYENIK